MYMCINLQQNRVSISVKTVLAYTNIFAQNSKLHKFATSHSNFGKKSIILNMHHCITLMYINFQQNRISRSVKTVHTNIFATNRKSYTYATTNSIFLNCLISYFRHASSYSIHVINFQQI